MKDTLELLDTRPCGDVALCGLKEKRVWLAKREERGSEAEKGAYESGSENQKPSLARTAVRCLHHPFAGLLVKLALRHYGVEGTVLLDPNSPVHVIKVGPQLSIIRLHTS